jgi:hypothetical protein
MVKSKRYYLGCDPAAAGSSFMKQNVNTLENPAQEAVAEFKISPGFL